MTNTEYLDVLRARIYAVTSKVERVEGFLDLYQEARRPNHPLGPTEWETATIRAWDRASATNFLQIMHEFMVSIERLQEWTGLAQPDPGWFTDPPDDPTYVRGTELYRSASGVLSNATQLVQRYQATNMWQWDELNAPLWDRLSARASRRIYDAPEVIGQVAGRTTGAAVGTAIDTAHRSGVNVPSGFDPRADREREKGEDGEGLFSGWDWKDYLALIGAGSILAGGLYVYIKTRPSVMAMGAARRAMNRRNQPGGGAFSRNPSYLEEIPELEE